MLNNVPNTPEMDAEIEAMQKEMEAKEQAEQGVQTAEDIRGKIWPRQGDLEGSDNPHAKLQALSSPVRVSSPALSNSIQHGRPQSK